MVAREVGRLLPNLIIIGSMKGGTSSLYHYLGTHPETSASSIKETNYFIEGAVPGGDLAWYESQFEPDAQWALEASPNYTKRHLHPEVSARMHALIPQARLVYLVRDPVERTISHYVHNYADGRESRPLSEAIANPQSNYVLTSRYFWQLEAFLEHYSKAQVLVVDAERLRLEPAAVVEEVQRFAGIPPAWDPKVLNQRFHESSKKKRRTDVERRLHARLRSPLIRELVRTIAQPFRRKFERPVLSGDDRERLIEELRPDVEELRRFSGLALTHWSS
jgi:hypothetical protein